MWQITHLKYQKILSLLIHFGVLLLHYVLPDHFGVNPSLIKIHIQSIKRQDYSITVRPKTY